MQKNAKNVLLLGSEHPYSAESILSGLPHIDTSIDHFKSLERYCELDPGQSALFEENKAKILGANVHVVMSMVTDPTFYFYDVINTVETVKEYGAASVHLVMPFIPFARQDRPFENRMVSIMAKSFPKHLKVAGVDRVTTIDMHSKASENYFTEYFGSENITFLSANALFETALRETLGTDEQVKFSAPDGADKPDDVAQRQIRELESAYYGQHSNFEQHGMGIIKKHVSVNKTVATKAFGDAKDSTVVIRDDMIDTGGTILNAADIYQADGSKQVIAMATHAIFSDNSLEIVLSGNIDHLIVLDTIQGIHAKHDALPEALKNKLTILSTIPLIKRALAPYCH